MAVVAPLVLGIGGAALGATFGQASLGWTVGSTVGRMLFPPKQPHQVGPRLGDLSVTSSAHGAPINIGYGTHRMNGNIIWAKPLKEVAVRSGGGGGKGGKGGGGKGGGGGSTTFQYYANVAVAFSEGVADDVLRIWANNELIYDKTGEEGVVRKGGLNFRFYRGTDDQMPDGLIQADKGADLTPAYRGICYIVFEDYNVTDIRHVPSFTAEITYNQTQERLVVPAMTLGSEDWSTDTLVVDFERGRAFVQNPEDGELMIRRFNLHNMREDKRETLSIPFGTGSVPSTILHTGQVALNAGAATNSRAIALYSGDTLQGEVVFGVNNTSTGMDTDRFEYASNMASSAFKTIFGTHETFLGVGTIFGHIGFLSSGDVNGGEVEDLEYVDDSQNTLDNVSNGGDIDFSFSRVKSILGKTELDWTAEFFMLGGAQYNANSSSPLRFYRYRQYDDFSLRMLLGSNWESLVNLEGIGKGWSHVRDYTPSDLIPNETELVNAGVGAVLDQRGSVQQSSGEFLGVEDIGIIFPVQAASDNSIWYVKVNAWTGDVMWRVQTNLVTMPVATQQAVNQSRLYEDSYGIIRPVTTTGARGILINTVTGEIEVNDPTSPASYEGYYPPTGHRGVYDSLTQSFIGLALATEGANPILARWYFKKGQGGSVLVSDIITDLCTRAGLSLSDIDVSDVEDISELGYVIGAFSTARQGISPLMAANFFDGVESDWKVKFVKRGASPVRELSIDDFMLPDKERGYALEKFRDNDKVLPRLLKVDYIDPAIDYESGAQTHQRTLSPTPVMQSENEGFIQLPIAMTGDKAAGIAEILSYTEWMERTNFKFTTDWTNLDLEPSDVITITVDETESYRARILTTELGANLNMEITATEEYAGQYVSGAVGASYRGFDAQNVNVGGMSKLMHIDAPLIFDGHEQADRATAPLYWQLGHFGQSGWTGAVAYKSLDNLQWGILGVSNSPMAWGAALNALGDPQDGNPFKTDTLNTLTVSMVSGEEVLESITYTEMLNGGNFGVLIKNNGEVEYIQWQDVEDNADGTFTLSNLLRGRRGTDTMAYGHGTGEIFIVPDLFTGGMDKITLGGVGVARYWKAVTNGKLFDTVTETSFTSLGRSLMPYAPYQQAATLEAGDDVEITWVRRTRVGGDWVDDSDTVQLAEDSEEYELEILDAPEGTVVRTVTGLTSPLYLYDAADQASDGFTVPMTEITVKVYQMSEQVGRGFTTETTIPVV